MGSKWFLICIDLLIMQAVYSQCVNRVVQGPNGPIELLPNQILIPPGVPYLPPGQQRSIYQVPGPNSPCQPAQSIVVPTPPIPTEYSPALPPAIANLAPPPNVLPGNVFVPNIPPAIPNIISGNVFVPNVPPAIPGNVFIPNPPSAIPNVLSGNVFIPNTPSGNLIVPNAITESYAPTVLYDNSVANSLANALQLLVVSSLLSNKLPEPFEPPCYNGYMPGYSYVY